MVFFGCVCGGGGGEGGRGGGGGRGWSVSTDPVIHPTCDNLICTVDV